MTGILFIVGSSRSGSTLLERLLNELPGVVSVGELQRVWRRGFVENQLCSCGQPFHDCAFWGEVRGRLAAGGDLDAVAADRLSRRVYKAGLRRTKATDDQAAFGRHWQHLFTAIAEVSGARWLVDSSKTPQHAAQLAGLPGFDTRYLHLVRDPRAVAFSKMRRRLRPEIHWMESYMATRSAGASAASWNTTQRLAERMRRQIDRPWMRLRYEDLAADPRRALATVVETLGLPVDADTGLGFLSGPIAQVQVGHSVSGNPMRFQHGDLRIAADDEWRRAMPARSRFEVALRCWRGLRRYGYTGNGAQPTG
ncbi:MAG: sulfotransferase [Immundisolibacter sp.]|uniref:sulfotransferase family protein n=1 Tax=Immundisolibacter sp. TaxID=1934948 RepID=UPI003D0EC580